MVGEGEFDWEFVLKWGLRGDFDAKIVGHIGANPAF